MKKLTIGILTLLFTISLLAQEETLVVVYEKELDGILTTSGDFLSNKALTAGHESLPMGSIVEFVNPDNQNRVELTINDRIPDSEGMFWISSAAAEILDIHSVYPTKILSKLIYRPEFREVYDETFVAKPKAQISPQQIETVSSFAPKSELVEKPEISNASRNPILDGLSENLEVALGDPRIPKSACARVRGYGVHVYTTTNSNEAIEASKRLYNHFACPSYIEKYTSPLGNCYRVIAGDYASEAEAMTWYNKLVTQVPDIFLVEFY